MTTNQAYDALDYLGFGTAMLSISGWIMEHLNLANINDAIQTFVGMGGALWIIHKVIMIRLEIKGEKLENRKKELEIQFKEKDIKENGES